MTAPPDLCTGLARAMKRAGYGAPRALERLTGGATMESWRFEAARLDEGAEAGPPDGGSDRSGIDEGDKALRTRRRASRDAGEPHKGGTAFILRRAPSLAFMEERPLSHASEAAVIRAAHAAGVTAPEVVAELAPQDGIGSGFVMRALAGTTSPKAILEMEDAAGLLRKVARDLAVIHAIPRTSLPDPIPTLDPRAAIADFRAQFEEAGGDRPIIALGIKWLEENVLDRGALVLNHGDYRLGNLLAENSRLTGVLDWELAHFSDPHEDLAFGCMAVWRFARYDRPALGLGTHADYFAAYEEAGGRRVEAQRFRYWTIHRTVWWALGCLRMAQHWRSRQDRMLERVVISRRTSEQELDLLMLLEEEAPAQTRARAIVPSESETGEQSGEASNGEIATAISEWLATIKDQMRGHDRFQLAVARNALGMIARDDAIRVQATDRALADAILAGEQRLTAPGLLDRLRQSAIDKLRADIPKYPALAAAMSQWKKEN